MPRRRPRCASAASRLFLFVVGALTLPAGARAQTAPPTFAMIPTGPSVAAPGIAASSRMRVDGSTTVRLCDCADRRIDFTIASTSPKPLTRQPDEQARLVDVLLDGVRVTPEPFVFRWKIPAGAELSPPQVLTMTVAPALRDAGTYSALVAPLPKTDPSGYLTFQVTVPAAQLDVPEKLIVGRTVYWPWGQRPRFVERQTPLVVRETGDRTRIERLHGDSMPMAMGTQAISGRIVVPAQAVRRDDSVTLAYALDGHFPLGVASGTLILQAHELALASKILVEVRSRLAWFFLVGAIVAGFGTSWLIKVRLAKRIELLQARVLAQKLLGSVAADRRRFAEREFADHVDPHVRALTQAEPQNDAAAIETARLALDASWREAVKTADTRRADLSARVRAFRDLVTLDWRLPIALRDALAAARQSAVRQAITPPSPDIAQMEAAFTLVQATFLAALRDSGADWQRTSRTTVEEVMTAHAGVAEAVASAVTQQLQTFDQRFPLPDGLPLAFDATRIEPRLRAVAGQYLAMQDIARVIERTLDHDIADAASTIPRGSESAFAEVKHRTARVKAEFMRFIDAPDSGEALETSFMALQQAWAVVRTAVAESQQILERTLGAAVRQMTAAPLQSTAPPPVFAFTSASLPGIPLAPLVGAGVSTLAPFASLFLSTTARLRHAKALQTILLAALATVGMFSSKAELWDGTWQGLLAVFLTAVMVDVSLDALLARARSPQSL